MYPLEKTFLRIQISCLDGSEPGIGFREIRELDFSEFAEGGNGNQKSRRLHYQAVATYVQVGQLGDQVTRNGDLKGSLCKILLGTQYPIQ